MARDQVMQAMRVESAQVRHDVDQAVRFQIARVVEDPRVDVFLARHRLELDHGHIAARGERAVVVEHVGDAARHAGGEIAAGAAEHHHDAAGHVFAAMVAGALDHRDGAGIAHGEALAGDAAEVAFALDRAVQHGVADDDRFFRERSPNCAGGRTTMRPPDSPLPT